MMVVMAVMATVLHLLRKYGQTHRYVNIEPLQHKKSARLGARSYG